MNYLYFPGCSLDGTALEYNLSTRALMNELDVELSEIKEWTCCGASAAEATSELLSIALPARTLALGEAMNESDQILVPCSACYLNLKTASEKMKKDHKLFETVNLALSVDDLKLKNKLKIRHLLDVLVNDIGTEKMAPHIKKTFKNFKIAPYYGCQCLRPYIEFDDPEEPHSMDAMIKMTGAEVFEWDMGAVCCGASHISTKPDVGLELVSSILRNARGADVILTVCPMCQMNLEANQSKISDRQHEDLNKTILYLPQFLGLAMGLPETSIRLDLNLAVTKAFKAKLTSDLVMKEQAEAAAV